MNSVSISQLKTNPSQAIRNALDFPVAVENRNKVEAYLIGKDLYEKMASFMEDLVDHKATEATNFSEGKDFENVAGDLDL